MKIRLEPKDDAGEVMSVLFDGEPVGELHSASPADIFLHWDDGAGLLPVVRGEDAASAEEQIWRWISEHCDADGRYVDESVIEPTDWRIW